VHFGRFVGVGTGNRDAELEFRANVHAVVGGDVKCKVHDVIWVFELYFASSRKRHLCNIFLCSKLGSVCSLGVCISSSAFGEREYAFLVGIVRHVVAAILSDFDQVLF